MISALAEAGAVLEHAPTTSTPRPRAPSSCSPSCATTTAGCCGPGRTAAHRGYLEDHAYLLEALHDAVRGDVRPALVPRGGRARRRDHRALRRPRARRLLHHRRRQPQAFAAAQGPRGLADPVGQLGGRVRPAAAGAAVGRGRVRAPRARRAAAAGPARRPPPARVRPPAAGGRLLPGAACARSRSSGRPTPHELAVGRARALPPAPGARRRRGTDGVPLLEDREAGRRPRGRVRVRALRLPGAGHDAEELEAAS